MSITAVLIAVGVLTGLALLFGLLLSFANKAFEVPSNPTKDAVRECLPGANCGGCGYAGCDALAEAIANGEAPINACPVGGADASINIAKVMGVEPVIDANKMVATVLCQGSSDKCRNQFEYHGIQDCVAAATVNDGNRSCRYACIGLGTCVRNCKFDAISIDPFTHIAKVDPDKCQSCGACVNSCPKGVLKLLPIQQSVKLLCRAAEKGKVVSINCKVGCIGCELCKKNCKFDAITIVNHLPVIDQEKCTHCMMCAEKCPTGALSADFDHRLIASIDRDLCVGCTICKKTCQFDAISGELKQIHEVNEACTGCAQCAKKCPKKAITMSVRKYQRDENSRAGTSKKVDKFGASVNS